MSILIAQEIPNLSEISVSPIAIQTTGINDLQAKSSARASAETTNPQMAIENLFQEGLTYFKSGEYFEAHESWEELWSDFYLKDRRFVQGLIQLSVSFVHLENNNLNGAKSLLNKCREKFIEFDGLQRDIDVKKLLKEINKVSDAYQGLTSSADFDWDLVPKL